MEAIGEHDFSPQQNECNDELPELPFKKGEKLLILNLADDVQWYNACKYSEDATGIRIGLVPGNYIKVGEAPWFHGKISRIEAEQLLSTSAQPRGAFLVRMSESSPNEFSLSVNCGNAVQHFRILKNQKFEYFLWKETFRSLNELVEYYRNETVSRTSQIFLCDMAIQGFTVVAKYDFKPGEGAQDGEHELAFSRGETIEVFDDSDENWWGGRIIGNEHRVGYFPKSYVDRTARPIQ